MRYGEVDFRPIEQMRRLLTQASEGYLANKKAESQMRREEAELGYRFAVQRKQLEDAEFLKQKKLAEEKEIRDIFGGLQESLKPKEVPNEFAQEARFEDLAEEFSLRGYGTDEQSRRKRTYDYLDAAGQIEKTPVMRTATLTPEQRNRLITESVLRASGVPGGIDASRYLHQYLEPIPKADFSLKDALSHGIALENLGLRKRAEARAEEKADKEPEKDVYNPTEGGFFRRVPQQGDIPQNLYDDYYKARKRFEDTSLDLNDLIAGRYNIGTKDKPILANQIDHPIEYQEVSDILRREMEESSRLIREFEKQYGDKKGTKSKPQPSKTHPTKKRTPLSD